MSIVVRMVVDSDTIRFRHSFPAIDCNFDSAMSTKGISVDANR